MKDVTLISMSKVYERESFCRPFINSENFIDCSDIEGTNCYVDDGALSLLRHQIHNVDARGIHFIDSGNYHYLSFLFLEKIPREFELVLIDKHPDCKIPMFESLMSCGGWVRTAFNELSNLKHVYMIGTDLALCYELDDLKEYRDKVTLVSSYEEIKESNLPIYLSIDKDVLDESVVDTNWDQGVMKLEELNKWINEIIKHRYLIGVDICGEADVSADDKVHEISAQINSGLLEKFMKD